MAWPAGRIVNARMRDGARLVLHRVEGARAAPLVGKFWSRCVFAVLPALMG